MTVVAHTVAPQVARHGQNRELQHHCRGAWTCKPKLSLCGVGVPAFSSPLRVSESSETAAHHLTCTRMECGQAAMATTVPRAGQCSIGKQGQPLRMYVTVSHTNDRPKFQSSCACHINLLHVRNAARHKLRHTSTHPPRQHSKPASPLALNVSNGRTRSHKFSRSGQLHAASCARNSAAALSLGAVSLRHAHAWIEVRAPCQTSPA